MDVQVGDVRTREVALDERLGRGAVHDVCVHHLVGRVVGTYRERAQRQVRRQFVHDPGCSTAAAHEDRAGRPVRRAAVLVGERQEELRQQALEDSGVQAMLDVFAAEIKDVEER